MFSQVGNVLCALRKSEIMSILLMPFEVNYTYYKYQLCYSLFAKLHFS